MAIDLGTGDGRVALRRAAAEPTTLVLGLDANARSMAESSRRAAQPARRGGHSNAIYVVGAAETPPSELTAIADEVTIVLPWGSLLRGCLDLDDRVARGIAGLIRPGGSLEIVLSLTERDGMPVSIDPAGAAARAFAPHGLVPTAAARVTVADVAALGSTWAKRLRADPDRPIWRLSFSARIDR